MDGARNLIRIVPHLTGEDRRTVLADAVAACSAASSDESRDVFWELRNLVPLVSVNDGHIVGEVMALTTTGPGWLFTKLAPQIPPRLIPDALAAARTFRHGDVRAEALASLVPGLTGDERRAVIAEALASSRVSGHARVFGQVYGLTAVLPYLTGDERQDVLAEALAAARTAGEGNLLREGLTRLLPHLATEQRDAVVAETLAGMLAEVRKDEERYGRRSPHRFNLDGWLRELIVLLPYLAGEERRIALEHAVNAAIASLRDAFHSDHVLIDLAKHLGGEERRAVLTEAMASLTLDDDFERTQLLATLFTYVDAEERTAALATIQDALACLDTDHRPYVLVRLLPHLVGDERRAVLARVLTDLAQMTTINWYPDVLNRLAAHLTAEEKPTVLAAVRTHRFARTDELPVSLMPYMTGEERRAVLSGELTRHAHMTSDERSRAESPRKLVPLLLADDGPVVVQALKVAVAIQGWFLRDAWTELAPLLSAEDEPVAVLALELAAGISDEHSRREALRGLAPYLPPVLPGRTLAAVRALREEDRAVALRMLVPHLTGEEYSAVRAEVLADTRALGDEYRAVVLSAFVPHLTGEERRAMVDEVYADARRLGDEDRAVVLSALVPYLTEEERRAMMAETFAAVKAISDERSRITALIEFAPLLSAEDEPVAVLALEIAAGITSEYGRSKAMEGLVTYLPPLLAGQSLAAIKAIKDEQWRASALAKLAPFLAADEAIAVQVLETAAAISDDYACYHVLRDLAPFLPPGLLPAARAAAQAISEDYCRAQVLIDLIPRLAGEERRAAWADALAAARAGNDIDGLARLARHTTGDEKRAALAEALAAARRVTRDSPDAHISDNGMKELVALLPPDLLAEALNVIIDIQNYQSQGQLLAELIPRLPPDLLVSAVAPARLFGQPMLAALIDRGHELRAQGGYLDLLRESIDGISRKLCFQVLTYIAPDLHEIGGARTVQECIDAVAKVHSWWL